MSICQHTHPTLKTHGMAHCCRLTDGHDGPHNSGGSGQPGSALGPEMWDEPVTRLDPLTYEVRYDPELGEVSAYWNSKMEEIIQIRANLLDRACLEAVVVELEKRGYTVTPPEAQS